jgi:hypothetical protein
VSDFQRQHARLFDALIKAAVAADQAGHEQLAASLRRDRKDITRELYVARECALRLDVAEQDALTRIALEGEDERAYEAPPSASSPMTTAPSLSRDPGGRDGR